MFEDSSETPGEDSTDPAERAREKAEEFRVHAQLAAVFEGHRKFDAAIIPRLSSDIARQVQRGMGQLEKQKAADNPMLPAGAAKQATELLNLFKTAKLSTNDYHVYRRPGEVMIARWLEGEEVGVFYERMQAHFDAAMEGFKEDERSQSEWKQDAKAQAFSEALGKIEIKMAQRYLREPIREHKLFVLSTQSADEMDILHLTEYVMGISAEELVGAASAPPDNPSERSRTWFFKLFSLRGMSAENAEQMCFFAYLQKSDGEEDW